MVIVCHMVSQPHKFIKVSHYHAKFGGHRQSGSEDIMFLVCHVILTCNVRYTCLTSPI